MPAAYAKGQQNPVSPVAYAPKAKPTPQIVQKETKFAVSSQLSEFPVVSQTFGIREAGYAFLDVGQGIRGHLARVTKSTERVAYLNCKLHAAGPPCNWSAALVAAPPKWELRFPRHEELANHNKETTALVGQNGFDSLEDRRALQNMLTDRAVPLKPRTAVRAHSLGKGVEEEDGLARNFLKKTQDLKRLLLRDAVTSDAYLGDLMQATAVHCAKPCSKHKGYLCVRHIFRVKGKAHVTLVATTPALVHRWTLSDASCVDGGHKFNIMKYMCTSWES